MRKTSHYSVGNKKNVLIVTQFFNNIDKDEAMYTFQTAELAIRTEALEKLDEKTVLIVIDWAMKFQPQK